MDLPALMMKSPCKRFTPSLRARTGFTLVEVLLAASILVFCLCGLLLTYANMFILTDLSRDFTLANNAIQAKIEEIKKTNFDSLSLGESSFNLTDYGFPPSSQPGEITSKGNITISSTNYSDLKRVRIIACFKSRGRIIGEDSNLNGQLDTAAGEDTNGNDRLDSPVEVVTLIAK